jgi:predicted phage-related endonuclease
MLGSDADSGKEHGKDEIDNQIVQEIENIRRGFIKSYQALHKELNTSRPLISKNTVHHYM